MLNFCLHTSEDTCPGALGLMGYRRPGSSFRLSRPHVMSTGRSVPPESLTCLSLPATQLSFADLKVSLPPPPCLLPPTPLKRERRNDLCGLDDPTSRWILDNQLCAPLYLVNMLIKRKGALKIKEEKNSENRASGVGHISSRLLLKRFASLLPRVSLTW